MPVTARVHTTPQRPIFTEYFLLCKRPLVAGGRTKGGAGGGVEADGHGAGGLHEAARDGAAGAGAAQGGAPRKGNTVVADAVVTPIIIYYKNMLKWAIRSIVCI